MWLPSHLVWKIELKFLFFCAGGNNKNWWTVSARTTDGGQTRQEVKTVSFPRPSAGDILEKWAQSKRPFDSKSFVDGRLFREVVGCIRERVQQSATNGAIKLCFLSCVDLGGCVCLGCRRRSAGSEENSSTEEAEFQRDSDRRRCSSVEEAATQSGFRCFPMGKYTHSSNLSQHRNLEQISNELIQETKICTDQSPLPKGLRERLEG